MPTVKLHFPGGRYHATAWGHHVNEGMIEWPPSPWRLLRALIASGFSSLQWTHLPPLGKDLIEKLAGVLPSFHLPNASVAHSRHFMPVIEGARQKPSLVFDTWANLEGDLFITWPCELNTDELALFDRLVGSLGYLGRSESWVVAERDTDAPREFNAYPDLGGARPGRDVEQVSLMAALPSAEYSAWRQRQADAALAPIPLSDGKKKPSPKLLKERAVAIAPFPPDLIEALTKDTTWWKQHGWSQPPGSRRVLYWRRGDALQVGPPQISLAHTPEPVTTMLLALTTPSGNRSSLPPVARTLPQAELYHRAIVGVAGKGKAIDCPELTGRDGAGRPLRGRHNHAYTLPLDLDGDGHLDHILIHAKAGLRATAQSAIRNLRRTWTKGTDADIQVALAGQGDLTSLRRLPDSLRTRIEALLGPPEGARVWKSLTPFVPPRFMKLRGKNTLEGQINAELASRSLPAAERVEPDRDLTIGLRHFIRRRQRGGNPPPIDIGYGLRLTFSEPVRGPIALGYASHFGLGMFIAVTC